MNKTMVLVAGVLVVLASGCTSAPAFECASNEQCVSEDGALGICELNQACSFSDESCGPGRRRYADGPEAHAHECVPAGRTCLASLAGGGEHFCAIRASDASVWCWGKNDAGQLGDGTTQDRARPVRVALPKSTRIVEVAAGEAHSCALDAGGDVYCWGANDTHELGTKAGAPGVPVLVPLTSHDKSGSPRPVMAKRLAVGGKHTCILAATGEVYCWGENGDGQCGADPDAGDVSAPRLVAALGHDAVALSLGDEHSAVLTRDGTVLGWGGNENGVLGSKQREASVAPIRAQISSVSAIAAGDEHLCAVKSDGTVWCWGYGSAVGTSPGPLFPDVEMPTRVGVGARVTSGGSAFHTCATLGDGSLVCWGNNDAHQVDDTDDNPVSKPGDPQLVSARAVALAERNTCAITTDGALWCWGANDHGQLARGATGAATGVPQRAEQPCE